MSVNAIEVALRGKAHVHCVHDREKRQVVTEEQVAMLGLIAEPPQVYDPKQHKLHKCACCDNLFVHPSDEPRYCHQCNTPLVHPLGGPLRDPIGVVA